MKDVAFTSYAFGELYVRQQERLRQSILDIYPDANIFFWHSDNGDSDTKDVPPNAPMFKDSMYGFKPYCIQHCRDKGFKKVIFLDAAMVLEGEIDEAMSFVEKNGVGVTIDKSSLKDRVSDKALAFCNVNREDIKDLTIVGGSLYIFDFNVLNAIYVFGMWSAMEKKGLFGSEEEAARGTIQGHRSDEACMSLALASYGLKPQGFDKIGYRNLGSDKSTFAFHKLHFKGIGLIQDHSVDLSLLPVNAKVLDLGCRDFTFTNALRELEHDVYPVDIGNFEGEYFRCGISHKNGRCGVQNERDPDATHIIEGSEINMYTVEFFSNMIGVDHWDLIKMDIEGEEYEILKQGSHPMASQISVEFHAHCTDQTKEKLDELLAELSNYYYIHNQIWKAEHSSFENYWDILLIAK